MSASWRDLNTWLQPSLQGMLVAREGLCPFSPATTHQSGSSDGGTVASLDLLVAFLLVPALPVLVGTLRKATFKLGLVFGRTLGVDWREDGALAD